MSEQEIEKKVKEINANMSLEGMPLTEELKKIVRNCFLGVTTPEKEIKKLNNKYKRINV
jgi:hypothetical protein